MLTRSDHVRHREDRPARSRYAERLRLKGRMFDRAGIDISGIQKAVEPTAKVLAAARKAGVKIIYLKMGYKPDL